MCIKYSQSNFHCDKVNSKSATRLFYRSFSNLFWFSKLDYLYFTAVNAILKTNLSFLFLQLLLNIHFKTCTQISHRQLIWQLRTADQLERMTLGTPVLHTHFSPTHFPPTHISPRKNEYILVFDFDPMETFVELLMLKKEDHLYVSLSVILFEILANDCSLTPMFYF